MKVPQELALANNTSRLMAPSTDIQAVIATPEAKLETKMNENLDLIVNRNVIPAAESTIVRRLDGNQKETAGGFCPTDRTLFSG
ncbi:hypothetical protein K3495_g6549 [Podosphaera aphanis]|nr:hypothetical protein K3495_g6549 [Podosphaera aphanis]